MAIAEAIACGTPALLPAELGTAPELLGEAGGAVYHDDHDLIELISTSRPSRARLAAHLDWDVNTAATVEMYRRLIGPAVGSNMAG